MYVCLHVCTMHAHTPHLNIDAESLRSMSKVLSGSCVDRTRLGGVDSAVRAQAQAVAHGPRCRMIHMQDQNRRWVPRCPVTLVSCPFGHTVSIGSFPVFAMRARLATRGFQACSMRGRAKAGITTAARAVELRFLRCSVLLGGNHRKPNPQIVCCLRGATCLLCVKPHIAFSFADSRP